MTSMSECLCVHPSVKWGPLSSLLMCTWVKPATLKAEQDLKQSFWKMRIYFGNKIWGCMKFNLKESWYDKRQKVKYRLVCSSLKLSSEGYGPALDTGEHDRKIPLLFLDFNITEPPHLLFLQQNSFWPWQEQVCTLARAVLNSLSLVYLFYSIALEGKELIRDPDKLHTYLTA